MALDLIHETVVSLGEARRTLIPAVDGKPRSLAMIYRWINRGVLARDGSRVKLDAIRMGRDFVTTRESVERFFAELTRRSGMTTAAEDSELPAETEHRLKAAGLLPEPIQAHKKTASPRWSGRAASKTPSREALR